MKRIDEMEKYLELAEECEKHSLPAIARECRKRAREFEEATSCPWCDEYLIEYAQGSEICPGCNEKLPAGKWLAVNP